jgi:2'-5' RNA ligase
MSSPPPAVPAGESSGALRTIGVAIAIPEPFGSELQTWREKFGDPLARAIPTHVTLLPPTAVEAHRLPEIEEHLRGVAEAEQPFELHLRGTGTFRPASPVVYVAVAEGVAGCERVERQVRQGPLMHRDLAFPYHPHVTVAHDLGDAQLDHAFDKLAGYEARFAVWGFSLYEHGLDGVWRPQRDFSFGGAAPNPPEA